MPADDLLLRCLAGDREARDAFVERYARLIYGVGPAYSAIKVNTA